MMEVLVAAIAGILVAGGIYLLTGPRLLHLLLGSALLTHGVNVAVFASGSLRRTAAPLADGAGLMATDVTDPLPQALVLTAIVIGFGVLAFALALAARVQRDSGEDRVDALADESTADESTADESTAGKDAA